MRKFARTIGTVIFLVSSGAIAQTASAPAAPAAPQPAPDATPVQVLVSEGEALAKTGQFSAAIEKWKQADKLEPKAAHACLIGLAYTRRELWPQAEIYFATCKLRSGANGDPLPTWLGDAEKQLAAKLELAPVAAVTVKVVPAELARDSVIAIKGFAEDETFGPRLVHLEIGKAHSISASAPGYDTTTVSLELKDKTPQTVTLELKKPASIVPARNGTKGDASELSGTTAIDLPPTPRQRKSKLPMGLMIGGGATVAFGVGLHLGWVAPARKRLADATSPMTYEDDFGSFNAARWTTGIAYGVGGAALLTGVVLHVLQSQRQRESSPMVGATVSDGGAMVTLGWQR